MERCETCRHFDSPKHVHLGGAHLFGTCNRILLQERIHDPAFKKYELALGASKEAIAAASLAYEKESEAAVEAEQAYIEDGEGYLGVLHPKPSFGCTMHETRGPP